jgi:type III restriction enzyme
MISIVRDDMDYLVEERALRIPEYEEISQGVMPLQTNFYKTRLEEKRNRIGSDFYKVLVQLAKETYALKTNMDGADWLEHNQKEFEARGVQMNVSELEISVLVDAKIRSEALTDEGEELLKGESDRHFVRTTAELQRQFKQFCLQESGDYARIDSYQRIENALCRFMEDFFKLTDYATYKVVLYGYNQPFWVEFLRIAREAYRAYKNQKAASKSPVILSNDWHVPIQKLYRPDVFKPYPNDEKAVLKPAMISVRQNGKFGESEPEERFLEFLEIPQNRKQIAWWYKNGVGDMSNFCVPYQRYNKTYANFYPDFIIQLNNKTMMVLDTKTPFSDLDTPNKHNRLADWARARSDMGKPTLGSIILFENGTWRFFKGMMDSESQKKPAEWPVLRLEDWGG